MVLKTFKGISVFPQEYFFPYTNSADSNSGGDIDNITDF